MKTLEYKRCRSVVRRWKRRIKKGIELPFENMDSNWLIAQAISSRDYEKAASLILAAKLSQ